MNKFKIYFLVFSVALVIFSCSKDEVPTSEVLRDFETQFIADNETIEEYLKTNSIQIVDDQDVVFTKIPENGTEKSIWSYIQTADSDPNSYPKLLTKEIKNHNIVYKVYYLKLRADNNVDGISPCMVDEVLVSYNGYSLKNESTTTADVKTINITSTKFESLEFPQYNFELEKTIRGWREILPLFKTGTYNPDTNAEDPAVFKNFGAGVMFIPSGLAYYNQQTGPNVPSYSPLVFSFKLYNLKRADQDEDGVLSVYEDVNQDGDITNDDTDGDGIYDVFDIDDDGDGKLTKNEIKNASGIQYSFDAIPDCSGNSTNDQYKKKHLDKNCF